MARKTIIVVWLVALAFAPFCPAEAQQPGKVPRIGYLTIGYPPTDARPSPLREAFLQGLRELGYVEGKNILIEYRYAEGKAERFPDLAAELVHLKVDIIVANVTAGALAAKKATRTIPIITVTSADPVGSGLVASLAHPGGNVTGLSLLASLEMSGKQLELLKEALPKLTQVAVLGDPAAPTTAGFLSEAERAAPSLGVRLRVLEPRDTNELDGAFAAIKKERPGALLVIPSPMLTSGDYPSRVASFATNNRLPAMYPYSEFVDSGGLMSYGPHQPDLYRRAAAYVDKILKGTKPADIPVEQPMKFEFVINLKAAKQIGLTIPQSVLYRADRVIK
jgi:putative tryptophan/tyrosine transport system substrate-binding protein